MTHNENGEYQAFRVPWPYPTNPFPDYFVQPSVAPLTFTVTNVTSTEPDDPETEEDEIEPARVARLVHAVNFLLDVLADDDRDDWVTNVAFWQERTAVRDRWLDRLLLEDGDLDIPQQLQQ